MRTTPSIHEPLRAPVPSTALPVLALALVPAGCRSTSAWDARAAREAQAIEVQVTDEGELREIEFIILPEEVPARVREAMDTLHPGGIATRAERELLGDELYFELTKEIGGLEVEAMFTPAGELFQEEVQVGADRVPEAVRATVRDWLGGEPNQWEEIRDGERHLVEYHAKGTREGRGYKLLVTLDGVLRGVLREIPAEIEVRVE